MKSDNRLISIYEMAKLGHWEYDVATDVFTFNDQFYNIFGVTVEEVGGYKMKSQEYAKRFIHPEDAQLVGEEIQEAIATGDPAFNRSLEHRIFYANGELGYISVRYFIVKNDDGITVKTYGVNQDITDRKRIEEALRERNEFIQTVLDNLPIGVALNRFNEGDATYLNRKFVEIYGWPKEHLRNVNEFFMRVYPDEEYRQQIVEQTTRDIQSGDASRMHWENITITTSTGEKKIINAQNIPLFNQNTMVSTVIDVTAQKHAERKIKDSDEQHRKLISNISDVIIVIDQSGLLQYISPNIVNQFGWQHDDLKGKHALETVHPDDRDNIEQVFKSLLVQEKQKITIEFSFLCKEGHYKPIELKAVNLINDPIINGFLANFRDISERKKAEKAVVESQRLGAIGEMSSAVAHDFNNSLQSIFGNLELALNVPDLPEKTRHYLNTLQIAASDAAARVRILQRFSGKTVPQADYKPVNLNDIVKEVIVQSRPIWKDNMEKLGKTITIETSYGEIPNVMGNDGELRSVLYNMVKNSIESMPKGGRLFFETSRSENEVSLMLTDSGIGMDEETKTRLFQPFYTTKGFEGGRGLGMSGSYTIVKEHQGKLWVKSSSPGKGTTMEVILPTAPNQEIQQIASATDQSSQHIQVLWVDDDSMIRDIAQEMIKHLGCGGDIIDSGEKALALLAENKYDLVITDIGMPGMSGWQLADRIYEQFPGEIAIAVLSGWGSQIKEKDLKTHHVDYVLAKPFKLSQLQKLINKVVN